MKPKRIQRKLTKGWKMPPNTVYVGRPGPFANPFAVGKPVPHAWISEFDGPDLQRYKGHAVVPNAIEAVRLFEKYAIPPKAWLEILRGGNLACWGKEGSPCHGDVLLKIANE